MKSIVSYILIGIIKFYRKAVSPLKIPSCRFTPTCSQYAIDAISTHGALKGGALSVWRIMRCNPFCKGGYDPVPPKKIKK